MKTSTRLIGAAIAFAASAAVAQAAEIILFEHAGFAGRQVELSDYTPSVNRIGFNDRTSSVVVRSGRWQVCTDDNFRGYCATLVPGQYQKLDGRLNDRISSVREVGTKAARNDREGRGPYHQGGYERVAPSPATATAITIFDRENLSGRTLALSANMVDLSTANFNDSSASVLITSGYWEFCSDAYYRGQCRVMGPGEYRRIDPALMMTVSSVRAAAGAPAPTAPTSEVELFTAGNFGGSRVLVNNDMVNFDAGGLNDRFSSVVINSGSWEICRDVNFRGGCAVFGPGRYSNLGGLTGQVSSMRRTYSRG